LTLEPAYFREVEDPETGEIVTARTYDIRSLENVWQIVTDVKDYRISTVFLGLKHLGGTLYETMVFGEDGHEDQKRYQTRAEAEKGHAETVAEWRRKLGQDLYDSIAWISEKPDGGAFAYDSDSKLVMELTSGGAEKVRALLAKRNDA